MHPISLLHVTRACRCLSRAAFTTMQSMIGTIGLLIERVRLKDHVHPAPLVGHLLAMVGCGFVVCRGCRVRIVTELELHPNPCFNLVRLCSKIASVIINFL